MHFRGLAPVAIAFVICLLSHNVDGRKQYHGHSVLKVKLGDYENIPQALRTLFRKMDVWSVGGNEVLFRVSPEEKESVKQTLLDYGLETTVHIGNLESLLQEDDVFTKNRTIFNPGEDPSKFTLDQFHNVTEIEAYIDAVPRKFPHVEKVVLGTTHEGRNISALKIGKASNGKKKEALFVGNIHARERATSTTLLYIIDQLTTNGSQYDEILSALDVYIVPVLNPDGHAYTWTDEPDWRKNRNGPSGEQKCYGVDAERNFDDHFGGEGSSDDPCDDSYHGPHAFSEKESQAVGDFFKKHKGTLKAWVDVHTYDSAFAYPFGYKTDKKPKTVKRLDYVAAQTAKAIKSVYGTEFVFGQIQSAIYPAAGNSVDYAYNTAEIPLPFAFELRVEDRGFFPPPSEIIPTAVESWAGLQVVLRAAIEED